MSIVLDNVGNCRYPGFSEYQSQNTLQNSSYQWSFPKSMRFNNGIRSLNPSMYILPTLSSNRTTSFGIGDRTSFKPNRNMVNNPSPDTYHLKTDVDLNLMHRKGPIMLSKIEDHELAKSRQFPGPGTYEVAKSILETNIPIKMKSRLGFFYDDEIKKRKHCVSMQRYHPSTKLEENLRYRNIGFGIGGRMPNENLSVKNNPGPGYYKVPGCFDRGYRGKLPLN